MTTHIASGAAVIFLVLIAFLGLIAWGCLSLAGAIRNKAEAKKKAIKAAFHTDEIHIDDAGRFLAFRYSDQHVIYGTYQWVASVPYSKLSSVEVYRNGVTVTRTDRGSQLLGAAIGGAAFGLPGALVGGAGGTTTAQDRLRSIGLQLTFDHPHYPAHQITFGAWPGDGQPEHGLLAGPSLQTLERFRSFSLTAMRTEP